MCEIELVYYISTIILNVLIISGFIWYIINLFRAWLYEKEINKLYSELKSKIETEKQRKAAIQLIRLRIEGLKEDYGLKIQELERKRQFILDKLPLVK